MVVANNLIIETNFRKEIGMKNIILVILLATMFVVTSGCTSTDTDSYETNELPLGSKAYDGDHKPRER